MVNNRAIPVDNSTLAVDNVATGVDSPPAQAGGHGLGCRPILTLTVTIIHLYLPADLAEANCEETDSLRGVGILVYPSALYGVRVVGGNFVSGA
jgi:hypothetical protein